MCCQHWVAVLVQRGDVEFNALFNSMFNTNPVFAGMHRMISYAGNLPLYDHSDNQLKAIDRPALAVLQPHYCGLFMLDTI